MADVGVFFDSLTGLEFTAVTLDVIISIAHSSSATATTNPVGAQQNPVTDHVIDNPPSVIIQAFVTDHVAGRPVQLGRAYQIRRVLEGLKRDRRRVGFVSGLEVFTEGVITAVEAEENAENDGSLDLTIGYQAIRTATAAISALPAPPVATKKARKRGGQATKEASAAKEEEGSIIYNTFFR